MDYLVYYGMTHNPFDKTAPKVIETVDYKELNVPQFSSQVQR